MFNALIQVFGRWQCCGYFHLFKLFLEQIHQVIVDKSGLPPVGMFFPEKGRIRQAGLFEDQQSVAFLKKRDWINPKNQPMDDLFLCTPIVKVIIRNQRFCGFATLHLVPGMGAHADLVMVTMATQCKKQRFIYKTRGVCTPEIHFQINHGIVSDIRFVGGGCTGFTHLVSRLLTNRPVDQVMRLVDGIGCRNDTSCPDQLGLALEAYRTGSLSPAGSFKLAEEPQDRTRIGLIGDLAGAPKGLKRMTEAAAQAGAESIFCLGNVTGNSIHNQETIALIRKLEIAAIQGKNDWDYARGAENPLFPSLEKKERDWLVRLPQVRVFSLGGKKGVAFFGEFIQSLPGFSDFEPFALEMNMTCGLTDFMRDETVFPALEAMMPQFQADIILFGQAEAWGQWHLGGKDIIRVGPFGESETPAWGLIESIAGNLRFKLMGGKNRHKLLGRGDAQ